MKKNYDFTQEWMQVELIPMQTITVKARGFKAKNATWVSDRPPVPEAELGKGVVFEDDVVRISKAGKITAIGEGVTNLIATGGGIDLKFTVSVCGTSERTLHLNVNTPKTVKLYGVKGKLAWTPAMGEPTDVVSIDPKGKITGLKAGEVTLETTVEKFIYTLHVFVEDPTVIGEDGKALDGKPGKYSITLNKGERKPVGFVSDFLFQTHIFTSNKSDVAYIGTDGLIYARNAGTAKLSTKVNGKKITITVKVNK